MRLLNTDSRTLEDDVDPNHPYAILSHTWYDNSQEPTYQDIAEGPSADYKTKEGWKKIEKACEVAKEDGFRYIWVDTCNIDKRSSSELTEAINSMFDWYRKSARCYAYLSDVNTGDYGRIKTSRWFTRGWTLQELLAPKDVVFYSKQWKPLGNKADLRRDISERTGISTYVLQDRDQIWETSIACRMSWAASRQTKRIEDMAYCLLGIFGVNMPLLYGERERAFVRLQEEIIKMSDDQTIFTWNAADSRKHALALGPLDFEHSGNQVKAPSTSRSETYTMTNKGLHIKLPMLYTGATVGGTGGKQIFLGILNCHPHDDFFKHSAIPLCETDAPDTYVRCAYHDSHLSKLPVNRVDDAEERWIYIQSHAESYYRTPRANLVCQLFLHDSLSSRLQVKNARVKGIIPKWHSDTKTILIQRTMEAWVHDVAAGFILHDKSRSVGFIVVVYFPHGLATTKELSSIQAFIKPRNLSFDQWLHSSADDLFSVHVRDVLQSLQTSDSLRNVFGEQRNHTHFIDMKLEPKDGTNRQIYAVTLSERKIPKPSYADIVGGKEHNQATSPPHRPETPKVTAPSEYLTPPPTYPAPIPIRSRKNSAKDDMYLKTPPPDGPRGHRGPSDRRRRRRSSFTDQSQPSPVNSDISGWFQKLISQSPRDHRSGASTPRSKGDQFEKRGSHSRINERT